MKKQTQFSTRRQKTEGRREKKNWKTKPISKWVIQRKLFDNKIICKNTGSEGAKKQSQFKAN